MSDSPIVQGNCTSKDLLKCAEAIVWCVRLYGKKIHEALASGLSPVRTQNNTLAFLLHLHTFALCALRDERCNNERCKK